MTSRRARASTLLLLVLPLFSPAAAADDAGTGADAPDAWGAATNVALGSYNGSLDAGAGDAEDWYRVVPAAGKGVQVDLTNRSSTSFTLLLRNETGGIIGLTFTWATEHSLLVTPRGGAVRIGVLANGGAGAYSLSATEVDLPDVRVVSLDVGPPTGGWGTARRNVTIVVDNHGAGAAASVGFSLSSQPPGVTGNERLIFSARFPLASGETRTLVASWNTTGQVGAADLAALTWTSGDPDASDNERTVRVDNLVEGAPVGVDLLNHQIFASGLVVFAAAQTAYDGEASRAFLVAGGLLVSAYAIAVDAQGVRTIQAGASVVGSGGSAAVSEATGPRACAYSITGESWCVPE